MGEKLVLWIKMAFNQHKNGLDFIKGVLAKSQAYFIKPHSTTTSQHWYKRKLMIRKKCIPQEVKYA